MLNKSGDISKIGHDLLTFFSRIGESVRHSPNVVILFSLLCQSHDVSSQDLRILLKDGSKVEVDYLGKSQTTLRSKGHHEYKFSNIDTVYILRNEKAVLRELAFLIPVKLNGKIFEAKELFVEDLPFTNSGELIFHNKFLNGQKKTVPELLNLIQNSFREVTVLERDNVHLWAKISESMSTETRVQEDFFYDETKMHYDLLLKLVEDSTYLKLQVEKYELLKLKTSQVPTKVYLPNEMFRKITYYGDRKKPKKLFLNYNTDTKRIVGQLYSAFMN